jgi:hypothetical protein
LVILKVTDIGLRGIGSNMLFSSAIFLALSALFINGGLAQVAGTHTDFPRWCGKAYEAGYVLVNSWLGVKPLQREY